MNPWPVLALWRSSSATSYADAFFLYEPLVAPWTSQDVTAIPLAGVSGTLGDKFVVQAAGKPALGDTLALGDAEEEGTGAAWPAEPQARARAGAKGPRREAGAGGGSGGGSGTGTTSTGTTRLPRISASPALQHR